MDQAEIAIFELSQQNVSIKDTVSQMTRDLASLEEVVTDKQQIQELLEKAMTKTLVSCEKKRQHLIQLHQKKFDQERTHTQKLLWEMANKNTSAR